MSEVAILIAGHGASKNLATPLLNKYANTEKKVHKHAVGSLDVTEVMENFPRNYLACM
jgi:hypothetical protein